MCGGFHCSKISLQLLNVLYLLVAVLLIGIAAYAKASAVITSIEIAGGIIASGLFLLVISFLGLFAAIKHHQVVLFFYIVILFILFIIQFCVSIACLALTEAQVNETLEKVWIKTQEEGSNAILENAEQTFKCCGWDRPTVVKNPIVREAYATCLSSNKCGPNDFQDLINATTSSTVSGDTNTTVIIPTPQSFYFKDKCPYCTDVIPPMTSSIIEATGGIGLFFSFTEMLGVWLAVRFRNQKDPKANPNQFL